MMSNNGMNAPFWHNGPSAGNFYSFPQNNVNTKSVNNSDFGVQRNR